MAAILPRVSRIGSPVKRMILCCENALHIAAIILTVNAAKRYLYFQQSGADPQMREAEGGNAKPSIAIKPPK